MKLATILPIISEQALMYLIFAASRRIQRSIAMPRLVALCILCLLLGGAVASTVYKWTDENGKVHYGDSNSGPNSKQLPITPPPPASKPVPVVATRVAPPTEAKTLSPPEGR